MTVRVTIVSRIYRPEASAASFFLGAVADALTDAGHEVLVLTARASATPTADLPRERVRTFPVLRDHNGYVRGYLPYLSFDLPLAMRLMFVRRPDVVLVEPPPTTGAVVRIVCALRRLPYVYDAADIWSDAAQMATASRTVLRVLRRLERFAANGARGIVTISPGVVDRLRDLGVRRPVQVTGFGADTTAFEYHHRPLHPLFVYAGSYSSWHGAQIALDALALLRAEGRAERLLIIGHGEREAMERRASDLGLTDRVSFAAPVTPAELSETLAHAIASIATVMPNTGYDYAFASKTYSSLAAGCPVVFAGPGPTGDFIRSASTHVHAGAAVAYDAAALAGALRAEADSPASPSQRKTLAAWTAREHSLRAVGQRVADVVVRAGEMRMPR